MTAIQKFSVAVVVILALLFMAFFEVDVRVDRRSTSTWQKPEARARFSPFGGRIDWHRGKPVNPPTAFGFTILEEDGLVGSRTSRLPSTSGPVPEFDEAQDVIPNAREIRDTLARRIPVLRTHERDVSHLYKWFTFPDESQFRSKVDVVMGLWGGPMVTGDGLIRFCSSLRATGSDASIVLFVTIEDKRKAEEFAREYGITIVVYEKGPWLRADALNQRPKLYHVFVDRFASFQRFLMMDVRDAFFQSDPFKAMMNLQRMKRDTRGSKKDTAQGPLPTIFASSEPGVYMGVEDVRDAHININWTRRCFGDKDDLVTGRIVLNTGTTGVLGRETARMYLTIFGTITSVPPLECLDQGAQNYVLRANEWLRQRAFIVDSNTGPFMAFQNYQEAYVDGHTMMLVGNSGIPYSIVHQYDRCMKFTDRLFMMWNRVFYPVSVPTADEDTPLPPVSSALVHRWFCFYLETNFTAYAKR